MSYAHTVAAVTYRFDDLKTLLAKASPPRSGDRLAGIAAGSAEERVAAQMALADLPLKAFLGEPLVPYESDEVTRLIFDSHDPNLSASSPTSRWANCETGYSAMELPVKF